MDNRTTVYVGSTSPQTLRGDIEGAVEFGVVSGLDPEHKTLIKINGNFDMVYPGSNTSPWFLEGLLNILRDQDFEDLTVIEGDLPTFTAEQMVRRTGFLDILNKYGVPFVSYESLPRDEHELPALLQGAQLINVPVFHGHGIAVISCATKNLFGLLPKDRRKYHQVLSDKLLDLAKLTSPMFTIVDGTVGLDGESTRRGNPRRLDLILAGWDPLAIDMVTSRIMGYSPSDIPLLALAEERGLLPLDIHLEGNFTWDTLPCYDFTFDHSGVRKAAMALEGTPLFDIPLFLWLEDRFRRLYHHYNYWKKRDSLFDGPWMEYDQAWR
jgi:uncharacterized protein (DUF362 family)